MTAREETRRAFQTVARNNHCAQRLFRVVDVCCHKGPSLLVTLSSALYMEKAAPSSSSSSSSSASASASSGAEAQSETTWQERLAKDYPSLYSVYANSVGHKSHNCKVAQLGEVALFNAKMQASEADHKEWQKRLAAGETSAAVWVEHHKFYSEHYRKCLRESLDNPPPAGECPGPNEYRPSEERPRKRKRPLPKALEKCDTCATTDVCHLANSEAHRLLNAGHLRMDHKKLAKGIQLLVNFSAVNRAQQDRQLAADMANDAKLEPYTGSAAKRLRLE
jgi:hypothetical protein